MQNKNIYVGVGLIALALLAIFFIKPNTSDNLLIDQERAADENSVSTTDSKTAAKTGTKQTTTKPAAAFPDLDFIDKRLSFSLKDFPDIKISIEKAVFGRGEAIVATGCGGVSNANFSTYFYPGGGVCVNDSIIDGSPTGIVAFHMLVENNSNFGFGGNSDTLRLHYLRSDSSGKLVRRFAHPLNGLDAYYINGYSSKSIILSYLVPEDQLVYDLIAGYKEPPKEPALEDKTLNIYNFVTNGLLVDFKSKSIKLIK